VSVGVGFPGVNIGINLPVYPRLVPVPGYPVYYAPQVNSNYFFYDGMYWVYQGDNWYASSWYNGPWRLVDPMYVPAYVLRVPVRYYRHAPAYFHGWRADAAPRWGDHWGHSWEQSRSGWDQWSRSSAPAPAPLPTYQQQYSGNRYPQASQQAVIQTQSYRYQPKDPVAQQHFEQQRTQVRSAPQQQVQQPQQAPRQQAAPHQQAQQPQQAPRQQAAPQQQPQQRTTQQQQAPQVREAPVAHEQQARKPQPQPQKPQPQQAEHQAPQAQAAHEQHAPQAQEKGAQGKGQDKGKDKEKGQEKDKEKGQGQEH
jgi:hypothetical protein